MKDNLKSYFQGGNAHDQEVISSYQ